MPEIRDDVAEVIVRYATGIDRRDWELFRTCFTDDVDADYGDIGHWHGVDEITEFMTTVHEPCGHTMHRITNVAVSPVDDEHAQARAYVDALVLMADNQNGVRATASTTTSWCEPTTAGGSPGAGSPRSSSRASGEGVGL